MGLSRKYWRAGEAETRVSADPGRRFWRDGAVDAAVVGMTYVGVLGTPVVSRTAPSPAMVLPSPLVRSLGVPVMTRTAPTITVSLSGVSTVALGTPVRVLSAPSGRLWWPDVSYLVEAELAGEGGGWTDITADVHEDPLDLEYGIRGNSPDDQVASTGFLKVTMVNDESNSAGLVGYYSPGHPQCRSGWAENIRIRLSVYVGAVCVRRWRGRLDIADPEPGLYAGASVSCTVVDYLDHLATSAPDVPVQIGETDAAVIEALLDAAPLQPAARAIGTGVDTYPYALDRQAGTLMAAAQALCLSSRGYLYQRCDAADGELVVYESRTARQMAVAPRLALPDTVLTGLARTSRSQTFDRLRITCHPRLIVPLASMAGPVALETAVPSTPLAPGETEDIWLDYTDPAQRDTRIAAANCISLDAGTDYSFNSLADGTGTNLTAQVFVTATFFATSVKVTITNDHPTLPVYRTLLQVRGDGIFTLSDVMVESVTGTGARLRTLDMPYQDDPSVARGVADSLLPLYAQRTVESVSFDANRDTSTLIAVLLLDIGDVVDVSETVTGTSQRCWVNGVKWVLDAVNNLRVTLWLAPSTTPAWTLGTAELGVDTRVGA